MIELNVIKLLLKKEEFLNLKDSLTVALFPKELAPLFLTLVSYYNQEDSLDELTSDDLANLYFSAYSNKDKSYYEGVFSALKSLESSDTTSKELVKSLIRKNQLKDLSLAAYEVYEGRGSLDDFNELVEAYRAVDEAALDKEEDDCYVSDDIEQVYQQAFAVPGLRWRLNTMNKMLGSLRFGDFGFVFARPETGKTTFLASELTYMAEQANGPVLWLANEEDGLKVMMRLYQAAFGIDNVQLQADLPGWRKKWNDLFQGKLKLVSRMDLMTKTGIERLADKLKPALIVIDQLSKVRGFENDRKDLELGTACEWGRTLAKTYAPTIAVHQASGEGEGEKWLTMNHVANAKTAMQAEADWILGIGCQHKEGYENLRYLHLSKNKLSGDEDTDPNLRHGKCEVLIEPLIGRYKDLIYV